MSEKAKLHYEKLLAKGYDKEAAKMIAEKKTGEKLPEEPVKRVRR